MTGATYHLTFIDDGEESIADVIFMGMQDGNLLFARPATVRREEPHDRPPVAHETVRMSDFWQSEGAESVEIHAYAVDELLTITADWVALHQDD